MLRESTGLRSSKTHTFGLRFDDRPLTLCGWQGPKRRFIRVASCQTERVSMFYRSGSSDALSREPWAGRGVLAFFERFNTVRDDRSAGREGNTPRGF